MRAICLIRKEPYYRRAAFEQGLKRVGFTLTDRLTRPEGPDSWLVIWNRHIHEAQADAWEANGGTVLVAENGYLQKVDKTHYAISVHGHNGSGWWPVGDEDRFSKLGFPLREERASNGGPVLVIGQRGIGSKTMRSPPQWAESMVKKLKQQGLPTLLRPHPGNFAPKIPLHHDLHRATRCVIWSSAAGVQALVEGLHVTHYAPHWICEGGSVSDAARLMALHRMSHAQWHHEEIATGEPFARVIAERGKASW